MQKKLLDGFFHALALPAKYHPSLAGAFGKTFKLMVVSVESGYECTACQ
jgi:hypothetical protein